jgi:hypothetical protein
MTGSFRRGGLDVFILTLFLRTTQAFLVMNFLLNEKRELAGWAGQRQEGRLPGW